MKARNVVNMLLGASGTAAEMMPIGKERATVLGLLAVMRTAVDTFFDDGVSIRELISRIKKPPHLDVEIDDAEIDSLIREKP